MMKVLIVDPKMAGITGDMLLASLVDLTGHPEVLEPLAEAIRQLPGCSRFDFTAIKVDSGGIASTRIDLDPGDGLAGDDGDLRAWLRFVTEKAGLSPLAREKSISVLDELLEAWVKLSRGGPPRHDIPPVHTLFEIAGNILILDRSGLLESSIVATPPALGGGRDRADGDVPGPAPLTLEILARHRIRYSSVPADGELTSPTGAALLSVLAERIIDPYPALTPLRIGYGTGHRTIPGRPDVIRVVEGEGVPPGEDKVLMLETNLDDISGETIGYTVERLFEEGAIDVFITPAFGKKNRPLSVISVMVTAFSADRLTRVLMEETGTLGVRVREFRKVVAERTRETVPVAIAGRQFDISIKISRVNGTVFSRKPEFDDLRAIARELHLPLRFIEEEVKRSLPGLPEG